MDTLISRLSSIFFNTRVILDRDLISFDTSKDNVTLFSKISNPSISLSKSKDNSLSIKDSSLESS